MNVPNSFITPSRQTSYRHIAAWYEGCVLAARQIKNTNTLNNLLEIKSLGNQVSLIYSLGAETARARWVLEVTLRCVEAYCPHSTELKLAAASLHQNLARLALHAGAMDLAKRHLDKMFLVEGLGEDAALQNFVGLINAHHVALNGDDDPNLAIYIRSASTEYAAAVRREAALIFMLRSGQYATARNLATEDLFVTQSYNIVLQLYVLLIEMRNCPASRFAHDIWLMIEEIESEEGAFTGEGIAVTKLLFRLSSIACLCDDRMRKSCVEVMERIGAHRADYYVRNAETLFLGDVPVVSPFHIEFGHRETLKTHAKLVSERTHYDRELRRIVGRCGAA